MDGLYLVVRVFFLTQKLSCSCPRWPLRLYGWPWDMTVQPCFCFLCRLQKSSWTELFFFFFFYEHTSYYIAFLVDLCFSLLRSVSRRRLVVRGLDTTQLPQSKMQPCASSPLNLSRHTINARNDGFYGKCCRRAKLLNGQAVLPNQATVLKIKRAREGTAGRPDVKPVYLIHKGLWQHRWVALSVQLEPSGRDSLSAVSCLFW